MPATTTMETSSVPISASRRAGRPGDSASARTSAGRVGNISRHSISQPSVKSAPTSATRTCVGRSNHRPASAIAPSTSA